MHSDKVPGEDDLPARVGAGAVARGDMDAGPAPGLAGEPRQAHPGTDAPAATRPPAHPPGPPAGPDGRLHAAEQALTGLVARNPVFCVVLGLGAVLRVIVMAGFQPAILIRLDSYFYMLDATRAVPDPDNTSGYALFLWLVRPFHSLVLVAGLQHLMGLGIAVLMYSVLRRHGVRGWVAALATAPVLFDSRELLVEQAIMSDTMATLLMVAAFAVLLGRRHPSVWRSATAGLLMGAASLVRPTALPLIVLIALYLLIKRLGWRRVVAALTAGVLPVVGYAAWFFTAYGVFSLTNSNGLFLWSRTMSFANCSVINPPADLAALCPGRNLVKPHKPRPNPYDFHTLVRQATPQNYLWTRLSWPWQPARPGYEPDTVAFTVAKNARGEQFALRAIAAQPLAYATVVAEGVALTFLHTDYAWRFPASQPTSGRHHYGTYRYEVAVLRAYLGTARGVAPYQGSHLGTRLVRPYAALMHKYGQIGYLPGLSLALLFGVALVGIFFRRSRTGAAVLLALSAVVTLVLPIAVAQFNYRYALAAVPLVCMAAVLVASGRPAGLPGDP